MTGRFVIGHQRHGSLEQQIRVVMGTGIGRNFGKEAQGLDVLCVRCQILAHQILRRSHLTFVVMAAGRADLVRQGRKLSNLAGGALRIAVTSAGSIERLQDAPTLQQARVARGRPLQVCDLGLHHPG